MCAYLFIVNAISIVYVTTAFITLQSSLFAACEAKAPILDYSDVSKLS